MRLVVGYTLVLVLLLLLVTTSCEQEPPPPPPDIPRYTADQVIYVANSNSPVCISIFVPTWKAEYVGTGRWLVTKECVNPKLPSAVFSREQWYFSESTGILNKK